MSRNCVHVGSTNADIAGLGVIVAFAAQGGISLVLSAWSFFLLDIEKDEPLSSWVNNPIQNWSIDETRKEIRKLKREKIGTVLATIADTQVLTGIALLLSSLIQSKSLDLYHYHIVYDTVNFTCVSFCAANLCLFTCENGKRISRFIAIGIFSILYLAFAIVFGVHLGAWSFITPGSCYNTRLIAASNAEHPLVDQIYLGITCFYTFGVLFISIGVDEAMDRTLKQLETYQQVLQPGLPKGVQDLLTAATAVTDRIHEIQLGIPAYVEDLLAPFIGVATSRLYSEVALEPLFNQPGRTKGQAAVLVSTSHTVLSFALAQYPLHLYSVLALRISNQHLLAGESENTWGFGQIVALVMLAQTFIECLRAFKEYRNKKSIIMAAENLRSIMHHLKSSTKAEVSTHASHPLVEVVRAGAST